MEMKKRTAAGLNVVEVPGDPDGATVLLFHGYGADAYDLVSLSQIYKGSPRPTWFFPNGPMKVTIAPGYEGHAWFPVSISKLQKAARMGNDADLVDAFPTEFIAARRLGEQLITELEITPSKLFIGGFSQGGVLATEIALHAASHFAGLLILSGTLINEKEWRRVAPSKAELPFFQSHGEYDSILPISRARDLSALLTEAGLKGHFYSFPGGHEIPHSLFPLMRQFFSSHIM